MSPPGHPGRPGRSTITEDRLLQRTARSAAPSFLRSLKAVGWSFFGVRRATDVDEDAARTQPLHLVVAALIGAALFIGVLLLIVQWVVGSTPAG